MRATIVTLSVVICASLACDGAPPLSAEATGSAGTTGSGGTTGLAGTNGAAGSATGAGGGIIMPMPMPMPPTPAGDCQSGLGDRYVPNSISAMRHALVGTWVRCSDVGLFAEPHAAIRIDADDHYIFLEDRGGTFVPSVYFKDRGMVDYLDTSGVNYSYTYQVNFVSYDGGTATTIPILSDVPRQLLITNNGPPFYRYRRVDPPGPNEGPTVGTTGPTASELPPPGAVADCTVSQPLYAPSQIGTLASLVRGTWVRCSASGFVTTPHDGVHVGVDGRWVLLEKKEARFVPKASLENKGFIDVVTMEQVDFVGDIGWSTAMLPTFTSDRHQMVYDTGFAQLVYARLP